MGDKVKRAVLCRLLGRHDPIRVIDKMTPDPVWPMSFRVLNEHRECRRCGEGIQP